MSRCTAPAFSVPRPTVTIGTPCPLSWRAASSGSVPVIRGEIGEDHQPGDPPGGPFLPLLGFEHRRAQGRLAPLGLSGFASSPCLGLGQLRVELVEPDVEVGPEGLGELPRLLDGLLATSQRVCPRTSSPISMLVLASSRTTTRRLASSSP